MLKKQMKRFQRFFKGAKRKFAAFFKKLPVLDNFQFLNGSLVCVLLFRKGL